MTFMKSIVRLIVQKWSAPSLRWSSTATEGAAALARPGRRRILLSKVAKLKGNKPSVADILNNWVAQGNEVKKIDIINISNYCRNRKNFRSALQLYEWMESSELRIMNSDHAIRISLLCKVEGVDSAEKYFNSLPLSEKTSKTYGAILSCYCNERVVDKALAKFEEMKTLNHSSTLNYNNMMALYFSVGQPEKVFALEQEMEEKEIAHDIYTYNLLINSFAALKNFDAIEGVLDRMKSKDVNCTLFTYGNLATIYFYSGFHEKARDFLGMMEKMKIKPGQEVLSACYTRIKLYSEMNDSSGVNRAWEFLKSSFRTINNTSYLSMLLGLSKLGDQENLEKIFKEWESDSSTFDFRVPNVMLEYYLSRDMIEEATLLHESLAKRDTEPNLRALNLFASLCMKKRLVDMALKYLEMGLDKAKSAKTKWFPPDETIKLFVDYFEENNDLDRAEKFIESMKKVDRIDADSLLSNIKASALER